MLIASGAGSLLSEHWTSIRRRPHVAFAAILGLLTAFLLVLPAILERLVGIGFAAKLVVSAALLVPPALAMGMPFPTGLRSLAENASAQRSIEWAWAMNAAASVLGSVAAMLIALAWGLNATLAFGATAYLAALLLRRQLLGARAPFCYDQENPKISLES
jgi:hypothetical protein